MYSALATAETSATRGSNRDVGLGWFGQPDPATAGTRSCSTRRARSHPSGTSAPDHWRINAALSFGVSSSGTTDHSPPYSPPVGDP